LMTENMATVLVAVNVSGTRASRPDLKACSASTASPRVSAVNLGTKRA
jgi:hypothetical protein